MDPKAFTDNKTGTLVPISTSSGKDIAFVPHPLPPDWNFPSALWPLLAEAKQELGTLNGIGRTLPNPNLLLQPLQRREAIRSSQLEGTVATPQELLLFELGPEDTKGPRDKIDTWAEVHNFRRSLQLGFSQLSELPLSLRLTRNMHRVLLEGVRGQDKSPGEFRSQQNQIGSDRRFIPPPVNEMHACLDHFEKYLHADSHQYDPLVRAFLAHYQFEAIHPFMDGNGRVGRALISLMIHVWCEHRFPWLYMSPYFDQYRDEYYECLFAVSTRGAWSQWIEYCLRGVVLQCRDATQRCELLSTLKEDYHRMMEGASPRIHPIIEELFGLPMLTVPSVAERFNITYPTALSDIEKLEQSGILRLMDNTRPKKYVATKIFDIAFEDLDVLTSG
jgi:Fic family protein